MVKGFYAYGVAASTYAQTHPCGTTSTDAVLTNIGNLLLANQVYNMHRTAHYVSGGPIVARPGRHEDHNPVADATLTAAPAGRADIPTGRRMAAARLIEGLTASYQEGWYSVIKLHGGGSAEAMKREIWRNYPVGEKTALVVSLLDRGLAATRPSSSRQPGECCATRCQAAGLGHTSSLSDEVLT
jgi:4-hydroxybutyryl-CoA dehydratase / vinylacetyl-CoA-Delta-isomerase